MSRYFPFFRIKFKERVSYVLGSNHITPLSSLPSNVLVQLLNKSVIITETGYNLGHLVDNWHKIVEDHFAKNQITVRKNFMDNYLNLSKLESNIVTKNFYNEAHIAELKERYAKKGIDIKILKFVNSPKLDLFLTKIIRIHPAYSKIFNSIHDVNLTFIVSHLYAALCSGGMDKQLMIEYLRQKKTIYRLDDSNIKHNKNYDKLMLKIGLTLGFLLSLSKIFYKKDIVDNMENIFFSDNFNSSYSKKDFYEYKKEIKTYILDKYILQERNIIWSKKVINFHTTNVEPLFVVGVAHLCDKGNLFEQIKKELNGDNFEIDIWNVSDCKFIPY